MKITVEHYDQKTSIEVERNDLTVDEYMELVRRISVSIYSESLLKDWFD